MQPRYRKLALIVLLGCAVLPAEAAVFHKWIDADGITHYSDRPPEIPPLEASRIELPDASPRAEDGNGDYYSIARQWQRVHRERLELEKIRLERAALKASAEPAATTVIVVDGTDRESGPDYSTRPYPRRSWRSHRPQQATDAPTGTIPRNWLAQQQRGGFYRPAARTGLYKFGY